MVQIWKVTLTCVKYLPNYYLINISNQTKSLFECKLCDLSTKDRLIDCSKDFNPILYHLKAGVHIILSNMFPLINIRVRNLPSWVVEKIPYCIMYTARESLFFCISEFIFYIDYCYLHLLTPQMQYTFLSTVQYSSTRKHRKCSFMP